MELPSLPYPAPSTSDLYERLEASNIRLDKAWAGVKEVLAIHLPGMVDTYNTKNNRLGDDALVCPIDYYTGGESLQDREFPVIVVGGEMEFAPLGVNAFLGTVNSCIWVLTRANTSRNDIHDSSTLAHLAWGVMLGFCGGYFNSVGQMLWGSLQPHAVRAIPKNEKSIYGGFFVALDIQQGPNDNAASLYATAPPPP
ncbi:MAG: hypothetical protein EOO38_07865 [Cytophagaceae bacterium]|nr:MAG: hypothetical protein EOO38_07865 [Cytophagaceae bacterium]